MEIRNGGRNNYNERSLFKMNFDAVNKINIPEGNVVKITDQNRQVIWDNIDYSKIPMFFTNVDTQPVTISLAKYGSTESRPQLLYSTTNNDDYLSWSVGSNAFTAVLPVGGRLYLKNEYKTLSTYTNYCYFNATGKVSVSGNIMSYIYYKNFDTNYTIDSTYSLFSLFTRLINNLMSTNKLVLPATSVAGGSYMRLFANCTTLKKVPKMILTGSIKSATQEMFYGCNSLREMTWTATIPPSIYSSMWSGCPADMIIYVPDESVTLYKEAAVWIERAAYIKGISEK